MRTARFHEIRDRAVRVVDRVFARPLRLTPMASGEPDPKRPDQHEFEAPLRVGKSDDQIPKGGGGKMWSTSIASGSTMIAIDRRTYTGPPIRQGDRIRDLTMRGVAYDVARIDDRDDNRIFLELTET